MNYYAEAIDIIFIVKDNERLTQKLLINLLKKCPGAICKAAEGDTEFDSAYKKFINELKIIAKSSKIEAIKKYRNYSGLGIHESKDFVESL